ncbi:MAG: aminotransferase class V-fold PLP-dependent enzyme [Candidatus Bathyarchaeia archaeon]|jgi:cysteine desulfurase family protein (TIGR01976 family)
MSHMIFDRDLLEKIRAAFPRASKDLNGNKRAFFDNGTGTLVVGRAAKAEAEARVDCSANVEGIFDESRKADEVILEGRAAVADLLNAPSPDNIIQGESTTSLFFNLSYAMSKELTGRQNAVLTEYEHYANISPWVELKERGKLREVRFARLKADEGTLDMEHLKSLINRETKIVSIAAASNALGTKSPLEEIRNMAKEVGAYFLVDAVHHVAHGPIDVQKLGCDFLVFSGYKLFAPHGSFMFGKGEHLEGLTPYKVQPAHNIAPVKWEWGTRDQAKFAAIKGSVDHLTWLGEQVREQYTDRFNEYQGRRRTLKISMDAIEKYELELSKAIVLGVDDLKGLSELPGVRIYGLTDPKRFEERDPTFSFKVRNRPDSEVVSKLWSGGIASRSEDFYSRALETYGEKAMIRISLVHHNTMDEVAQFLKIMNEVC